MKARSADREMSQDSKVLRWCPALGPSLERMNEKCTESATAASGTAQGNRFVCESIAIAAKATIDARLWRRSCSNLIHWEKPLRSATVASRPSSKRRCGSREPIAQKRRWTSRRSSRSCLASTDSRHREVVTLQMQGDSRELKFSRDGVSPHCRSTSRGEASRPASDARLL